MNKLALITYLLLASMTAQASYSKIFDILYRNQLSYSSYTFIKKAVQKKQKLSVKKVENVLSRIHPSVFVHDEELDQFVKNKTVLDYAVAVRRFFQSDYSSTSRRLKSISRKSLFYVEKSYLIGLILMLHKKTDHAAKYLKACIKYSSKGKRHKSKHHAYTEIFRNRCVQQLSRLEFSRKNYKKALRYMNLIKKTDYIWPKLLLDKAWTYYWNKEKPRALGSIISYNSPILQRYMQPEANYLKALIYYELCYLKNAENIYDDFNKKTWKYRKVLLEVKPEKLYKLMLTEKEPKSSSEKFLYYYLKSFKKDIKYFTYLNARKNILTEIKKLKALGALKQVRTFLKDLKKYHYQMKRDFLDFIQTIITDYYYQIKNTRRFFTKLSLMINLRKRKFLRDETRKENEDTEELDLDNIPNTDGKYIWDFRGGFWADELGDYAVALKNRCEK